MYEWLEKLSDYMAVPRMALVTESNVEWDIFPAVAKLNTMAHKTQKGGVITNIFDSYTLKRAVERLLKIGDSVIIQEQIRGAEIFLSVKKDPYFGPVVCIAPGGVYVEVFKPKCRLVPLERKDAEVLANYIEPFLKRFGGKEHLIRAIDRFSSFFLHNNLNIAEINPLIVNSQGAFAVDIRVIE